MYAHIRDLCRWDEAIEVLKKALELEPKSKEISAMLRDTMRKSKLFCRLLPSIGYSTVLSVVAIQDPLNMWIKNEKIRNA